MVTNITNLSRSGLYDWMLQRLSAIVLAAYTLFIVGYILTTPELDYGQWSELFSQVWVRIFSFLALLSLVAHAWVGMWTIATDYLNRRAFGAKSVLIRFPVQLICFIALFSYLVWGIQVIWGL
ncbi:succinate dehydrogenase, hydrophobic membrane anchor protein [Endozoicomonas gorgoniicola]|uniref:Succinate dehydrogenase hydrophobic membrane anchor subunit n=1 Tax=Endozoicomonas gorgoniicola TaxID=1234144 RepID=A0ABT3MQT3_9GAMM|nr:succinate dehydrogenase, hydrophobic membrane anchor protein [Endozoicomonas gorgoniicola]MCW7551738.1 succinate dehydrogenase, hydrophobic membrane anchor protein [Endozoicomonas gorgoniicola]